MSVGGLVDKIKISTLAEAEDAMGNLTAGGIEVALFDNHKARITVLNGEDQLKIFGFTGKKMWKVIAEHMSTLTQEGNYYLTLAAGASASVISASTQYKVCYLKHQRDNQNNFRHTSLVITLD